MTRPIHFPPLLSRAALLAIAMVASLAAGAQAATFSGATLTDDATIYLDQPSANCGAGLETRVGRTGTGSVRRMLVRFDLSSIPTNATVTSVSLGLTMTNAPGGGPASTNQSLHAVSASWVEGSGTDLNGLNVVAGAVSWNSREHATIAWSAAGGDYAAVASATLGVTKTVGGVYTWTSAGMAADVQAWVASGGTNNVGWIIIGDEATAQSVRGYASSETAGGSPPLLTVNYTLPSPTPTATPTVSPTDSPTPLISATPSDSPTASLTPSPTPTASPSTTATPTPNAAEDWEMYG